MRSRLATIGALISIAAASSSRSQDIVAPDGTARGDLASRIDLHLTRAERFGFAGVVIVAQNGDVVLHKGYGLANRETGERVTGSTVFDIGSITKPFTAAAVLKLEDEGKLHVNDPIDRYFDNVPTDKKAITIHHLLTHTAGLQDGFGGDYDLTSRDSLMRVILSSKLQRAPGSKYEYSNAGYSVLGAIIEKVSGQPYEQYLRDHVIRPAGLTSTGYRSVDWKAKSLAIGYRGSSRFGTPLDKQWLDDGPSWHLRANGGLLSTAADLYRFVSGFHNGRIVSAASYKKAVTPQAGFSYGYGWGVSKMPNGKTQISHNGSNGYFYALATYLPDDKVTVIFLTNDQANRGIERDIGEIVMGRKLEEIPAVASAAFSLDDYAGGYRTPSGAEFEVRKSGQSLEITRAPAEVVASITLGARDSSQARLRHRADSIIAQTVGAMASDDYAMYRDNFWSYRDYRIDGEIEFWKEVLNDWRDTYGNYLGTQVLGTARTNSDDVQIDATYVAVKYAKGERVLRVLEPVSPTGKFFVATVSLAQWPSRFVLAPRSRSEFITYNIEQRKSAAMTFVFDDAGKVKAIAMPDGLRAKKSQGGQ
jgi:CubicO group peptidase (beta-lactamase class C family)